MNFRPMLAASAFAGIMLTGCQPETKPVQSFTQTHSTQKVIVIEVKDYGTILFDGDRVTHDELTKRLEALPVEGTEVHLNPGGEATYGDMVKVMAALQRTGHSKKRGIIGGT